MFNQTTPQDYLNDLHAIGIPKLFHPRMNPRDRATGIQNAKKELNRLKVELQHHRDTLRNQNKKASSEEVKRILAPYNLLQNLVKQLTEEVNNLEDTLASGKMLPKGFEFGLYIFGDEEQAEWFIGDEDEYNEWMQAENVKQRLETFKQDSQPLRDKLEKIQSEFVELKSSYQVDQKKLDKRHKRGYILRRMMVLFLLVVASGGIGGYVYTQMGEQLGLIGVGLAAFFFLLMPLGYMDWKRRNTKLVATVREQKTKLRRLQMEGKEVKKRYYPIEVQIRALEEDYKELRAGLSGGQQATSVA